MTLTCYIDEAGCPGRLTSPSADSQPFLIVAGVCLRSADDTPFTRQFTALKQRYLEALARAPHQRVALSDEIKGCALRTEMRQEPQGTRPAHVLLNDMLRLLKAFDASVFARVAPKPPGGTFDGKQVYARAMHGLARDFHRLLELRCAEGFIVADFREPKLNALMAEPICAAKYLARDELPRLAGAPTFGDSQSHAGLQAADLLASALLFPAVSARHAGELPEHPHLHENDRLIARRYQDRLRALRAPTWPLLSPVQGDERLYALERLLA